MIQTGYYSFRLALLHNHLPQNDFWRFAYHVSRVWLAFGQKYYLHSPPHFHRGFCFVLFSFFLRCSNITSVGWQWHSHESSSMWKIKTILCIMCLCLLQTGDLAHILLARLGFLPKKIRHGMLPGLTLRQRQLAARTHGWRPGLWRVLG